MDQDYSDYKEIDFNCEKDFNSEIDEILCLTSDILKDWKDRECSIKKIGGIILGNYGENKNFLKIVNTKLTNNLIIQMNDLRSAIMKEACRVISFISENYKINFEGGALLLFSSSGIFKLICSVF